VVDDHPIVREGVISVLEDREDMEVVGSAGSAEEALPIAERLCPDIVLLDLELPGLGGLEAIPRLLEASPATGVIVFTAYETDERILGALRAGARGYLLKGAPAEEIVRAVHMVHAGGSYLEPRVAAKLVMQVCAPAPCPGPALTPREQEVLRLLGEGMSNKRIARALCISERTVKFHVGSVFTKLGAGNRTQAVALAVQRGLL
jgi:DNA-binding NarL/FixJ family response regulator